MSDTVEPRVFSGRYRLDEEIGRGGMGVVYRGRDEQLERDVAIKLIQGTLLGEDGKVRFVNEAKACARITSAHVVSVFDFGVADDEHFMIMEFVNGFPLRRELKGGRRIDARRAQRIAVQICHGLGAAHAAGVVHRDLKPANVMLTEADGKPDFVKILDFGVAKMQGEEVTRKGHIVGTVDYMAPELIKGDPVDGRADLYALGVMLYRMLTGTKVFAQSSSIPGYHNVYSPPSPPANAPRTQTSIPDSRR